MSGKSCEGNEGHSQFIDKRQSLTNGCSGDVFGRPLNPVVRWLKDALDQGIKPDKLFGRGDRRNMGVVVPARAPKAEPAPV